MSTMLVVRHLFRRIYKITTALCFLRRMAFLATARGTPISSLVSLPSPSSRGYCQRQAGSIDRAFNHKKSLSWFPRIDKRHQPIAKSGIGPMNKKPTDGVSSTRKRGESLKEIEILEGRGFSLSSKKGRREFMEDRHAIILDISGDLKQAFFVVIDGHSGHYAAEYVAKNLGNNVVKALEEVGKGRSHIETAIRGGYSAIDKQFLAQNVNSGACATTVLLLNGELHVANVGDCNAVLSRNEKAFQLTNEHRLISREDEHARIENAGGYLHYHHGVCRVNGSISVSRAFGDLHLKDWIICEPDIVTLPLTSDCEFLIMASDQLWDKVSDQEAVMLSRKETVY